MAPRETENNAYAKFWSDQQRVLWYVISWSGQLGEPFAAARFTNRDITLLQKDRVITTSKHAQSDTVSIQVRLNKRQKKDRNIEMLWMFVYGQHISSAAKKVKKIHVIRRKSTVETIPKKSFNAWKKKSNSLTIN